MFGNVHAAAVVLALLVLVASGRQASAQPTSDATERAIDAGRLEAMMTKSEELLHVAGAEVPDRFVPPAGDAAAYAALRDAVERYGRLVTLACREHRLSTDRCDAAPYAPVWLHETITPPASELRRRLDDTSRYIVPFWNALCAGEQNAGEIEACQIE